MASNEVKSNSLLDLIDKVNDAKYMALDKASECRGSTKATELMFCAKRLDSAVTWLHWLNKEI